MDDTESEKRMAEDLRQAEIERGKAKPRQGIDRAVERITGTVQPGADPPSRAGIGGPGSGADSERG